MRIYPALFIPIIIIISLFVIMPLYAVYTPTTTDNTCAPGAVATITTNGLECKLVGNILAQGSVINNGVLTACPDSNLLWTDDGMIKCVNLNCPTTGTFLAGFKDGAVVCRTGGSGSSAWSIDDTGTTKYVTPKNGTGSTPRSVKAPAYFYTSDERLKENFMRLTNSLQNIQKLNGYTFSFKNNPGETKIGFKAQEVETVFPEVVHEGGDGYKNVDYASLVPVLLESIRELNDKVEQQQQEIDELKSASQ